MRLIAYERVLAEDAKAAAKRAGKGGSEVGGKYVPPALQRAVDAARTRRSS